MAAREQRVIENSRKRTRQNGVGREDVPIEKKSVKVCKRKKELPQQHTDGMQMQDLPVEHTCAISSENPILGEQGLELGFGFKEEVSASTEKEMDKIQKDELRQMVQKVLSVPTNTLVNPTDRQVSP
jgi:hypothetical protein